MGGKTVISYAEMDSYLSEAEKLMTKLNEISESIPGRFTHATNAGFLTGIVKSSSVETSTISNNVGSVRRIAGEYKANQSENDRKSADSIKEIEVTTDFYANNDTNTYQYNQVLLEKMDGTSVNEGQVTDSVDVHGDEAEVDVTEIEKQGAKEGDIHDEQKTTVKNQAIANINIAEDEGVVVDADSKVAHQNMGDISGGETAEEYAANASGVNQQQMGNINTGAKTNDADGNMSVNINSQTLQSLAAAGAIGAATNVLQQSMAEKETTPSAPISDENLASSLGTMSASKKEKEDENVMLGGAIGAASIAGLAAAAAMIGKDEEESEDEEEENNEESSGESSENKEEKEESNDESSEDTLVTL